MDRTGTTIAGSALATIRASIAADDPLFASNLGETPAGGHPPGFADLFLIAAGSSVTGEQDYLLALEYTFEGYLLHYGKSRLLAAVPDDLALLAGDYMFARGINHLTVRGSLTGIHLLAQLISFCSLVHCEGHDRSLAADAWALTALRLAQIAGSSDEGETLAPKLSGSIGKGDDIAARLKNAITEAVDGLAAARSAALRDELCNIYSSFNQQRRPNGTG